jgi:hypothetical protein
MAPATESLAVADAAACAGGTDAFEGTWRFIFECYYLSMDVAVDEGMYPISGIAEVYSAKWGRRRDC